MHRTLFFILSNARYDFTCEAKSAATQLGYHWPPYLDDVSGHIYAWYKK
jgi:hypothetical protein